MVTCVLDRPNVGKQLFFLLLRYWALLLMPVLGAVVCFLVAGSELEFFKRPITRKGYIKHELYSRVFERSSLATNQKWVTPRSPYRLLYQACLALMAARVCWDMFLFALLVNASSLGPQLPRSGIVQSPKRLDSVLFYLTF